MRALIRLPWPPSKTSKNGSQGDWRGKAKAARSYKEQCAWECVAQRVHKLDFNGDIPVTITYYPPDNRRVDWDNLAGRAKQGFDAVAEATGVDDGNWSPVLLQRGEKTSGGAILVDINSPPQGVTHIEHRGQING